MTAWGGRDPQFPERRLVTPSRLRHPEMMVIAYLVMSLIVGLFVLACLGVVVWQFAAAQAQLAPVVQIMGAQ